jgi:hypothetical protein
MSMRDLTAAVLMAAVRRELEPPFASGRPVAR